MSDSNPATSAEIAEMRQAITDWAGNPQGSVFLGRYEALARKP